MLILPLCCCKRVVSNRGGHYAGPNFSVAVNESFKTGTVTMLLILSSCQETSRGCHMVPVCASSCIQVIPSSVVAASATSRAVFGL